MWHLCYTYDFREDAYIALFFSVIFLEHTVTVHSGLHGKSTNKQNAAITDANAVLKYKKP